MPKRKCGRPKLTKAEQNDIESTGMGSGNEQMYDLTLKDIAVLSRVWQDPPHDFVWMKPRNKKQFCKLLRKWRDLSNAIGEENARIAIKMIG